MNSVHALAERYLSILRKRDFKPPYLLGGSSFGGLVAYEMAQQLKRYGEEVRLVIMIDTPAPSQMPRNLTDSAAILQYLLQGKLSLSLEKLRTLSQQAQIDYVLEEARLQGRGNALPPHLGIPLFSTWIAHQEATFAYTPEPYHDDVVFFQHTEPMENFPPDPGEAWKELVEGAIEVHHVPGNHISMNYPPHVKTLANHMKHILRGYLGV
jgi:thioesterase domain-containing protein